MVNHHMILAGVVTLLGIAAYETNGFQPFDSQSLLGNGNLASGGLARNATPNTHALDRFLDSSTNTAKGYGSSLTSEMKSEVSKMTNYVEEQCRLLAHTVQGANVAGRQPPHRAKRSR